MSHSEKIICKPTPWFLFRAGVILAMFSVFSVLFYLDGTTGYRKKNFEYYVHATFEKATKTFSKMDAETPLTEETWREFASKQTVDFPNDPALLPSGLKLPMPWPEVLTDYSRVKTLQHNHLWLEYSGKNQLNEKPAEKAFDAEKIEQQILVFYICVSLSVITLFFLIRTVRRSIIADEKSLTTADGKNIPYENMRVLDLRKWDGKGIAFIEHETPSGMKRSRIDGLTYGGFSQEKNQPAEQLMRQIRSNFTGEIIDYCVVEKSEG
ncbi:MAG: hypothetical protein V4727_11040 [Verrucomicrobiota bacterium]